MAASSASAASLPRKATHLEFRALSGAQVSLAALKGKVVERDFADIKKSTAFLAFSESWMGAR